MADRNENIVVCVRLRPLSETEEVAGEIPAWDATPSDTLTLTATSRQNTGCAIHEFDKVFAAEIPSPRVYEDVARPLVESAMSGMNGTIFAYGQTGSGKTYTMNFITKTAAEQIFTYIARDSEKQYLIKISAIEIYNEVVRDLLVEESSSLRVLDDPERGPVVERLKEVGLMSKQHMEQILTDVENKRQTAAMRLNEFSSRSHTIVRLYAECSDNNLSNGEVIVSTINFVDLAGSERSTASGFQDNEQRQRLKEGCHINRSLLTLGTVIRRLADNTRQTHIPYRDSNLTRILQPSLSGNARMAIVCTINPALSAVDMSRAALHFATCAKKVQMRPQINKVLDSKAQIKRLMEETRVLKKQLAAFKTGSNFEALNLELQKKDEEILNTTRSRNTLQKRLENLEKLVLRANPATPRKRRVSFSDNYSSLTKKADQLPDCNFALDKPLHQSGWYRRNTLTLGALDCLPVPWNEREVPMEENYINRGQSLQYPLMDWWIPPVVRQRLLELGDDHNGSTNSVHNSQNSGSSSEWKLENLTKPKNEEDQEALAELQDEIRLAKNSSVSLQPGCISPEIDNLFSRQDDMEKEEFMEAFTSSLEKSEHTNLADEVANDALAALEKKINAMPCDRDELQESARDELSHEKTKAVQSLPLSYKSEEVTKRPRKSLFFEFLLHSGPETRFCENGDIARQETTSLQFRATARFGKPRRKSAEEAAIPHAIEEQMVIQPSHDPQAFQKTAQEDLLRLRRCLEDYKSAMNRLECQKRMLLSQVLKLESRIGGYSKKYKAVDRQLTTTKSDLKRALESNRRIRSQLDASSQASSSSPGGFGHRNHSGLGVSPLEDVFDRDSWADSPTVEVRSTEQSLISESWVQSMLPKIVQLWEELHVPLRRRSKFFLAFRGAELFYYEAEHRRLLWEKGQIFRSDEESETEARVPSSSKVFRRAARRLENERKWLATQLKFEFDSKARESLFQEWEVPLENKERKFKLVQKFWSAEVVRQPGGMERSANIVLQLVGENDMESSALDLIFRPPSFGYGQQNSVPYLFSQISRRFSRQSSSRSSEQ